MYKRVCESYIMVVDDMPVMTELIMMWLVKKGYKNIHCFNNPQKALQSVQTGTVPDLIITDYHMGGMNGITLLSSIARSHPDIPGIIVSCAPQDIPNDGTYIILHKNDMLEMLPKIIPRKIARPKTCGDLSYAT